jgi:mRNA-degrading endonuclease RelE of RelBE toxin-antitoxin system
MRGCKSRAIRSKSFSIGSDMSWNASYASSFEKDLLALRPQIRQKTVQAIRDALSNPHQGKKLQGRANRFSIRLGRDYRLVYSVYSHERLVDFEFVGNRKEAYRWIRHV